jgi:hypothetical protein
MNEHDESAAIERLNDAWDALLGRAAPAESVAEPQASAIRALHALDDAPDPDPVFVARLRTRLLTDGEVGVTPSRRSIQSTGLVQAMPIVLPRRTIVKLAVAAIAAALLIAALSGGGRWLSGNGHAPAVASALASSVAKTPTVDPTSTRSPIEREARTVSTAVEVTSGSDRIAAQLDDRQRDVGQFGTERDV